MYNINTNLIPLHAMSERRDLPGNDVTQSSLLHPIPLTHLQLCQAFISANVGLLLESLKSAVL